MIQEDELNRLLAEADRIERTTSIGDTDKFSEAVTAFANDLPNHRLPGYLVISVNDDGTPSGLEVTDQLLQNLGGLKSDGNIQPLPSLNVAKFSLPGAGMSRSWKCFLPTCLRCATRAAYAFGSVHEKLSPTSKTSESSPKRGSPTRGLSTRCHVSAVPWMRSLPTSSKPPI